MVKNILQIAILSIVMSSCVSQKKYQALETSSELTQDSLRVALASIQKDIFNVEERNRQLQEQVLQLRSDTTSKNRQLANLALQVSDLEELNNNLAKQQTRLMQQNIAESRKILEEIQHARRQLQIQEDALDSIRLDLEQERENLNKIRKELGIKNEEIFAKNVKIAEMEDMIRRKDSITEALRMKVKNALVGFEGQGLTIEERDGNIYVLLDEALLFSVGRSDVAARGQEALKNLAKVLEQNPDINIMIEGHTDNTGGTKRNWELSTQRALAISHILLDNSTIDGARITVAGRGQFKPIDTASTPEARARNRRSEIILTPDLRELFELIHSK